jgi:glycosyltransferase involved in cell wall biosynthesis
MNQRARILVLNQSVSGMNRFLFGELEKDFALLVEDVPMPKLARYLRILVTFHPDRKHWRKRLYASLNRYYMSDRCFRRRSAYADDIVAARAGQFDAVLQIGGLWNGLRDVHARPRVVFASFNTTLAWREWKPWAPFASEAAFRRWFDLERAYYRTADAILCTNRYAMRSFTMDYGIPPEKLHYIGYGVNFNELLQVQKTYRNRVALFVGYDFERKGGPTIVDAFRQARADVPDARLRIIGPSSLDDRYRGEGIDYLPPIRNRAALLKHFEEADFFVMPSTCEPFGLVFLEAMAYGNPCIGSTNNAMPEIIDEGGCGYLIAPGDAATLARHMKRLFLDEGLKRQMGAAALRRVQCEFTWQRTGERARSVLRALVGQSS